MRLCCSALLLALLLVAAMAAAAAWVAPRIKIGRASALCCRESTARLTTNRILTAEFMAAVLLMLVFGVERDAGKQCESSGSCCCVGGRNY